MPGSLELLYICRFVLRQYLGAEIVHADLGRYSFSSAAAVAGEHDAPAYAQFPKPSQGRHRLRSERVGHAYHSCQRAGNRQVQMRIVRRDCIKPPTLTIRHNAAAVLKNEVRRANLDGLFAHAAGYPMGDYVLHLAVQLIMAQSKLLCPADNCVRHRVREVLLQACGQAQHFVPVLAAEGDDVRHLRAGACERTGLVKDNRVGACHRFKELSALDCDVVCTAFSHGGQHGQRHGQLESAGEVDHQDA